MCREAGCEVSIAPTRLTGYCSSFYGLPVHWSIVAGPHPSKEARERGHLSGRHHRPHPHSPTRQVLLQLRGENFLTVPPRSRPPPAAG